MGDWRTLDDVAIADCALEIRGTNLEDLFTTAAHALADVMADPGTVPRTVEREVTVEAASLDLLLFDWLGELITLKDSEGLVFPEARVRVTPGPPWRVRADLVGGRLDAEPCARRADPKAVTFYRFAVEQEAGEWRARVVIDI